MTKEETKIQNEIILALNDYGIVIRQQSGNFYTSYGNRIKVGFTGISDLQYISDSGDMIAFLEVKTAKGKPSKEQINFIDFINKKQNPHLVAGIVRNTTDALKLIGKGEKI